MIKGSCLCGTVQFQLDRPPDVMNLCHCSMCRKVTGSAFGVFVHTPTENFRWLAGESALASYESSREHWRVFCATCGSSMPNVEAGSVCIPTGAFDDDPGITPSVQIFVGSKANWHDVAPQPPGYDEFEPDD